MKKIDYHIPFYRNNYFHVYNRANGNEKLFYKPENYKYFIRQYKKYLGSLISTYSFCLLPNHFHILIKSEAENPQEISEQFRKLFISYSMSINKQENRKGSLLQRGVRRVRIEDESHLLHVVAYIHNNPVHHALAKDYKKYPYSSFRIFNSTKKTSLERDEVFSWFAGKKSFLEYHDNVKENILKDYYAIEDITDLQLE